jgi:rhodanese-related sulfurtransferase
MPTKYDEDATDSAPIIQFDARLEISPFLVFRRLREGKPVALVDVRKEPKGFTLEGSEPLTADFEPPADGITVLFDDDGKEAIDVAEAFQERGHAQVKALFGGLDLWKFSLDPKVVGEHTYLIELPPEE